ncbi:MAG: hypothetical protein ACRDNW_15815 [Trebonia sp.]
MASASLAGAARSARVGAMRPHPVKRAGRVGTGLEVAEVRGMGGILLAAQPRVSDGDLALSCPG